MNDIKQISIRSGIEALGIFEKNSDAWGAGFIKGIEYEKQKLRSEKMNIQGTLFETETPQLLIHAVRRRFY